MAAKKDFSQDSTDILGIRPAVRASTSEPPVVAAISDAATAEQKPSLSRPKPRTAKEETPLPTNAAGVGTGTARYTAKAVAAKEEATLPTDSFGDGSPHCGLETPERGTYYLPKAYKKAIRLRIATSDNPQDKDISSILRTALDNYLSPELQQIRKNG